MGEPDLEERIARAFETARARWPDVSVDPAAFEAHASTRHPAVELYLVCGLLEGDANALARFDAEYLADLSRVLARFSDSALVDEVRQILRTRLLVGPDARLATFTGKGPLAKWIEVAALRAAISVRRAVRDVPVDDRTIAALHGTTGDPQLAHLKATYRAQFVEAWRAALRALSPDDRTLLRLHVVDRVAVDRLGAQRSSRAASQGAARDPGSRDLAADARCHARRAREHPGAHSVRDRHHAWRIVVEQRR
jgi:RNA polymerase sigma-70 factor, ECF subfamily